MTRLWVLFQVETRDYIFSSSSCNSFHSLCKINWRREQIHYFLPWHYTEVIGQFHSLAVSSPRKVPTAHTRGTRGGLVQQSTHYLLSVPGIRIRKPAGSKASRHIDWAIWAALCALRIKVLITVITDQCRTSGIAFDWGTALKAESSRVLNPNRSLNFMNIPNPSSSTRTWSLFSL
jgi:hypothetical protein